MKGLRLEKARLAQHLKCQVRIDLIYEGIATLFIILNLVIIFFVRIDLIYEGIATFAVSNVYWLVLLWSELT